MPLEIHDNLRRTLEGLDRSYESLSAELLDPEVAADHRRSRGIAIRRAALEPLVERWREIAGLERELDEATALAAEPSDAEMAALAREEAASLEARAKTRLAELQERLVTADDDAIGATILEIRAGVGGDEAALFAGDLLEMYRRFAAVRRWSVSSEFKLLRQS
ncbi:MAG: PCRF domain-containing protein, partial [Phycisphaerales bacterium]